MGLLLAVLGGAAALLPGDRHGGSPAPEETRTYASPDGAWSLTVDPRPGVHPGGSFAAYTMRRGNDVVWSAERPYLLWSAVVSDDGDALGFGHGAASSPSPAGWSDDFVVLALGEGGDERHLDAAPREEAGLHSPPEPWGRWISLHPERDRAIVAVNGPDRVETWRAYRASTGELLGVEAFQPSAVDGVAASFSARPVPGTPLMLVHGFSGSPVAACERFLLLDADLRVVWELETPPRETGLEGSPHSGAALRAGDGPGRFGVVLEGETLRFEARRADGGWRVEELGARATR